MATVTFDTIQKKVKSIIRQKKNYAKNIRNYMEFMDQNCLVQNYFMRESPGSKLHLIVQLFGSRKKSFTFNVYKIQQENTIQTEK